MKTSAIPNAIVDSLNALFDAAPAAVSAALGYGPKPHYADGERVREDIAITGAVSRMTSPFEAEDTAPSYEPPALGVLDFVNAIMHTVAPGRRVCLSVTNNGIDGFVLGRVKPTTTPQA